MKFKLFHGSAVKGLTALRPSSNRSFPVIFFSDEPSVAATYTRGRGKVYPVTVTMNNPLVVDAQGRDWENAGGRNVSTDSLAARAYAQGHDGIIIKNVVDEIDEEGYPVPDAPPNNIYAVFDAVQVKMTRRNPIDTRYEEYASEKARKYASLYRSRHIDRQADGLGVSVDMSLGEGNIVFLDNLVAAQMKTGIGSKMMHVLTDLADEVGVTLMLTAQPIGGHIPLSRLVAFYEGFGFVENMQEDEDDDIGAGVPMIRRPERPNGRSVRKNPSGRGGTADAGDSKSPGHRGRVGSSPTAPTIRRNAPIGPRPAHRVFTDSPAFKRWFGRSVLVRQDGDPLVLFHGTDKDFEVFEKVGTTSLRPLGFWFADDPDDAEAFGDRLMPVYLRVENPYYTDLRKMQEAAFEDKTWAARFRENLIKKGHDGIIIRPKTEQVGRFTLRDPMLVCVFDPRQVKSAIGNRGTYDPADPSILRNPMRFDLQYTPEAVEKYRGSRAVRSILSPVLQRKSVERMAHTRHTFVVVIRSTAGLAGVADLPLFPNAVTLGLTIRDVAQQDEDNRQGKRELNESLYTAFTYLHRFGDTVAEDINLWSLYRPHERRPNPVYMEFYAMTDAHLEALAEGGWARSPRDAYTIYSRLIGESVNSQMVREGYSQDWTQAFGDLFPLCELTPPSRPLLLPVHAEARRRSARRTFNEVIVPDFNVRFRDFYNNLIPSMYGTAVAI